MLASDEVPADSVPFAELCTVLEKLHKSRKKQDHYKILNTFINDFRVKSAGKKNSSFFPILRLLLPKEERERSAYNMKESKLGSLLVNVLSLSKTSDDAKKLLSFRSVSNAADGDFAGVAYFVLRKRMGSRPGNMTIGTVNKILDKIATAEVGNKAPILDEAMSEAMRNMSAEQFKWFLRIILKNLKLGIGHHAILAAFHPDAPELYDNCGKLTKVCEELEDGETRPPEAGIQLFCAVSPMLSERLDVTTISKLAATGHTYHIETKFDGERFQIHMNNGEFEYFSRKGHKYSDKYGKTFDSGLLTPQLRDCFGASVTSCILDGEMMGWHKVYQCFGSKGMAFDIKKITENSKFRPCFCAFDVLYYNGKSLVGPPEKGGMPLSERLKLLDTMFTEITGVICRSKRRPAINIVDDTLDALNKAIDNQDEGIVVKATDSYYIANRRNAGWYKVKPEYTDNAMNDLDFVVVGADEAENKRQGRAKSFLIACADKLSPDAPPHRWVCVGRVSSGLSHAERARICSTLERHWVSSKLRPPPPLLVFNKEKTDFWVLPEHSIAFEVRATELIRSNHFGTEYTLRFPRVVKIREDKPVNDVMTLDQFNRLVEDRGAVVKLSNKRINKDQIDAEGSVPKKRAAKVPTVAEQFRTLPTDGEVQVTSHALRGRKLCVLSDEVECSRADLKKIILKHDGKHVENLGPDVWCGVVGQVTHRIRNLIAGQNVDLISAAWLRSLPASSQPCNLSPVDMLCIKKSTKQALSTHFDKFGDSYTELIDEDTLKKCFKKMDDEPEIYLTNEEMLELDKELFGGTNPFSFLRTCYIYFHNYDGIDCVTAKIHGATICDVSSRKLTHVVVHNEEVAELEEIKRKTNALVVSEDWLDACFREETVVSERDYLL